MLENWRQSPVAMRTRTVIQKQSSPPRQTWNLIVTWCVQLLEASKCYTPVQSGGLETQPNSWCSCSFIPPVPKYQHFPWIVRFCAWDPQARLSTRRPITIHLSIIQWFTQLASNGVDRKRMPLWTAYGRPGASTRYIIRTYPQPAGLNSSTYYYGAGEEVL